VSQLTDYYDKEALMATPMPTLDENDEDHTVEIIDDAQHKNH
jgi:hypothetical protein